MCGAERHHCVPKCKSCSRRRIRREKKQRCEPYKRDILLIDHDDGQGIRESVMNGFEVGFLLKLDAKKIWRGNWTREPARHAGGTTDGVDVSCMLGNTLFIRERGRRAPSQMFRRWILRDLRIRTSLSMPPRESLPVLLWIKASSVRVYALRRWLSLNVIHGTDGNATYVGHIPGAFGTLWPLFVAADSAGSADEASCLCACLLSGSG